MANQQDLQFLDQAATSGVTEIADGVLALSFSPTFAVAQLGQQEVIDHSSFDTQLALVAQTEGLPAPVAFSPAVGLAIANQENFFGPNSDLQYLYGEVAAHQADIVSYQQEATSGADPLLRAFSAAALPVLVAHLNAATVLLNQELSHGWGWG